MVWRYAVILVAGYLLGNISMGLLISRRYHMDIREHGSGNAGTTNVLRTLGWLPSVLTLLGDAVKAFLASMIGYWLVGKMGVFVGGMAAMIGHNWPVFFGFRGGKGMAAALGMVLAIWWPLGLILLAVEILIAGLTGYVSVASIVVSALFPVAVGILFRDSPDLWLYVLFSVIAAFLTIFSHRANIQRLRQGRENRLDFKKIKRRPEGTK
ncbi:MAG TPA: glycerol-3-phosphate 1-O-acyltransferase PlsY [Candidatus Pullichristensenella excrementigallinarum]|uniref:Glycerol-3-phosphate acyltransferase n=1 Tax=Candidatus Pullichristensenella excrementigallinarum TaxID=2840907 RepID=A0A9D1IE95_9FIRM|nr:glycerol-3-phosphate 1-O-acyltransferase PlsY [Candidatus Pullichristensenella excrementigallinarum]